MAFDLDAVRKEFPILSRQIDGSPLVYLDSGNTSQKPRQVIDAMTQFLENSYAPINRSSYRLAGEATEAYEGARRAVARLINAPSADEVIFTKNATESINLIARSWGVANLGEGDVVVLTHMEHHANIVPWQMLRDERGIEIRWVPLRGLPARPERSRPAARGREGLLVHGDEQRRRHDSARRRALRGSSRRRSAGRRRRMPVRSAQRDRRAGLGCRPRRILQPQDVRTIGDRDALGPHGVAR